MSFLCHLCNCLGVLLQLLRYLLRFCWALVLPRAVMAAQLLAIQSQLAVELNRSSGRRKRHRQFSPAFRILWVMLSKFLNGWEELVHIMKPATVKRWHTRAFRAWWRWKSKAGRKPVALEIQQLIRRLSKENPLWGAARIRDVLLLMGYEAPGEDTVRKYMVRPRQPRSPSTTWLPFLRNHVDCSWAIDFFTVTTLSFQVLYVFLVFDHARRQVLHFAITPNPTMEWVIQQLREATAFGCQPRYLFRDNDGIYGHGVRAFLISCGILEVRTAYQSPWQNPYIERFIGTLRRELLDHVIVLNQHHLERLLKEFIADYYHPARPHQGLSGETPLPQPLPGKGEIVSVPVLGGLHHRYLRLAA
ncbi:MAG: integrase core domain-containing protein [Armatimonadetes bacterium]|nr:integrase core domain-containing protein [Armatimonadota bacterium]